MKNLLLITLTFICFGGGVYAQTEATTTDGKKVILNDDGTWKYKEATAPADDAGTTSSELKCDDLILTETDKMTGNSSTSSKKGLIVANEALTEGFNFFFMKSKGIIMSIKVVGASSCIDDDSKMNVLFRDGTRLEMINNTKFNCKGNFTLYFLGAFGKKKQLAEFTTKEIETIRIWTRDGYVERDFTPENSKEFMKTLECLQN